jgi:hypothetical protein
MRLAKLLLVTGLTLLLAPANTFGQKACEGRFTYSARQEGQELVIEVKSREYAGAELTVFSADNKGISKVTEAKVGARSEALLRVPAGPTYFIQVSWEGCSTTLGGVEGISTPQASRR